MSSSGQPHGSKLPSNTTRFQTVVYHSDNPHGHGQSYFIVTVPGCAKKWRQDKTIPLVDVVQAFHVYKGTSCTNNTIPKRDMPCETKGNETKRKQTNETKRNETKRNESKRKETNQNEKS